MATVGLDITAATVAAEAQGAERAKRPAEGLTRRASLNAFATLLDHAVKGGVMAVVTPALVAGLGSSLFGVWQMLSRLVTYMQAADGRPTQALKWVVANQQASDDVEAKRRHVGSALGVWLVFLPALTVLSAAMVWAAPFLTAVPPEQHAAVRLTCALLVANFLLANLISLPEAVLRGSNLGYKRMGLQAGLSVVGGALTLGALRAGAGLVGVAAAQVLLAALTGVLFLAVVKRFVPWFGVARPALAEVRSFLKLSVWYFAWTLIHRLLMASDILVLGFVASASAVTSYTLTGFAGTTLMSVATTMLGAATPGLGGIIGRGQYGRAARLRGEMWAMSWLLLAALGSTILLWNRSFVTLWVGAEHYAGPWANLLVVLMIVQLMFIRNDAYVIDLTLQLRRKVVRGAVAAALSLVLSAALIPAYGIAGLCAGMIAGRLVLTFSYPSIVRSQLGVARGAGLASAARPALVMAAMFAASAYLGQRGELHARGWLVWVAGAGLTFCLALGVALFAGLGARARASLLTRFAALRERRPDARAEGD